MKIVLISGKAQNGKDYCGNIFKNILEQNFNKKVLKIAFADCLKWLLTRYFDWDGNKDEAGRELLQYVGTDLCKANNPNQWAKILKEILLGLKTEFDCVIITDARFLEECRLMKETFFPNVSTVRISRYDIDNNYNLIPYENGLSEAQKAHSSEVELDKYKFDFSLDNVSCDKSPEINHLFEIALTEDINSICSRLF